MASHRKTGQLPVRVDLIRLLPRQSLSEHTVRVVIKNSLKAVPSGIYLFLLCNQTVYKSVNIPVLISKYLFAILSDLRKRVIGIHIFIFDAGKHAEYPGGQIPFPVILLLVRPFSGRFGKIKGFLFPDMQL